MIFYNNALLLQVLLSFSFANGSHILLKQNHHCPVRQCAAWKSPIHSRAECQILYSTFSDWAGSSDRLHNWT